jgi:hypothetical protein
MRPADSRSRQWRPDSLQLSAAFSGLPQTWFLDAVMLVGRDLLADTLDVKAGQAVNGEIATLTQHRGSLAGTPLDETGGPCPAPRHSSTPSTIIAG